MSDDEHRRDPRVARGFMIRYRSASGGAAGWMMSPLRDLSVSGARFVSEQLFTVGALLEIQLVLPVSDQPVDLEAKVAWSKPGPLNFVELGVTFELTSEETQRMLGGAVTHFLQQSQQH